MAERRFENRVVMITGAAGGFGAEAARRFGAEGAALVLSDMDKFGLAKLADDLSARGIKIFSEAIDVTSENQIK